MRKTLSGLVSPVRILLSLVASIFCAEVIAMAIISQLPPVSFRVATLIDGLIMVTLIFPLLYFLVFRKLTHLLSERQDAYQALHSSAENYEQIFSLTHVSFAVLDPEFNILRVNPTFANVVGQPAEYLCGQNLFALFPHLENLKIFQTVVKTGEPYSAYERPFTSDLRPDLGVTYWDWNLTPMKSEDGRGQSLLLALIDRTARIRAQQILQRNEAYMRAVLETLPVGVGFMDAGGTIVAVNTEAKRIWGGARMVGMEGYNEYKSWWPGTGKPVSPDEWPATRARRSGRPCLNEEIEIESFDGVRKTVLFSATPIPSDPTGSAQSALPGDEMQGVVVVMMDITERKRAEDQMERSFLEMQGLRETEREARQAAENLSTTARALGQSLNFDDVLDTMLEYMQLLAPFDSAQVILLEDDRRFTVRAERGMPPGVKGSHEELMGITAAYPYLIDMLARVKPVLIANTERYPEWRHVLGRQDVKSWMGIPLTAGGNVVGFAGLDKCQPRFFTVEHRRRVEALAAQAATAIQNAWLFEQVQAGSERLQQLSHRLVEVQEGERRFIARELHDESGQMLTSLMVNLKLLENHADQPDIVREKSAEVAAGLQQVLKNLHGLAMALRPATLDHLGLAAALRQLLDGVKENYAIDIRYESVELDGRLPPNVEIALYRIVQEATTNIVRHASAQRMDVLLQSRQDKLVLVIEDDGIGFDYQAQRETGRLGIVGMQERVEMLGGELTIESAPGKGATIVVELPYDHQNSRRG